MHRAEWQHLQAIARIWQPRPQSCAQFHLSTCWHSLESLRAGHGGWPSSSPSQDWGCQGCSCSPYSGLDSAHLGVNWSPYCASQTQGPGQKWGFPNIFHSTVARHGRVISKFRFLPRQQPSLNSCTLSTCNFIRISRAAAGVFVRPTANLRLDKYILKSTGVENFSTLLELLSR